MKRKDEGKKENWGFRSNYVDISVFFSDKRE